MKNTRRTFLMKLAAGGTLFSSVAHGQAKVDEKDPQAVALGYLADATKVDAKKHTKYAAGQVCNNCALYQAKASDAWGGCPLFAGKQVAGKGWCSAWAKKG
jgi:hypothetical protein